MQTHQKLVRIRCAHHDLFQKVGYLCYCLNGSRTQFPFRYSVSHLGNRWGLWESANLQFPMQAAGVVEAMLTHGTKGHCVCVCMHMCMCVFVEVWGL